MHGGAGGEAPRLDIQDAATIENALHAFADGRRKSGFMQPVAAALDDAQISALAAYLASDGDTQSTPAASPPTEAERETVRAAARSR